MMECDVAGWMVLKKMESENLMGMVVASNHCEAS